MHGEEEEVQELTTDAQQFQMEEERVQQTVVEKREVQGSPVEEREGVHHLLMEEGVGFQQFMREEEKEEKEEEEEEKEEEEVGVVQTQMKEEGVQRSPTAVVGEEHRVLDTETDGSEQQRRPDSPQFYLQEFDVRVVTSQCIVCVLAAHRN